MKSISFIAAAGLLATFGASPASAWSGDLVKCVASHGGQITVSFSKGLTCQDAVNKINIKTKIKNGLPSGSIVAPTIDGGIDNCEYNPAAPWAAWEAAKFEKVVSDPLATTEWIGNIANAELSFKGQTFGSCNFGGSPTSASASGAGAVTFYDDQVIDPTKFSKVKGAKLKYFANVAGDVATVSAALTGLVTKGLGVGGNIETIVGIDVTAPSLGLLQSCNDSDPLINPCIVDPTDPTAGPNAAPIEFLLVATQLQQAFAPDPFPTLTSLVVRRGDPSDVDYSAIP